MSHRPTRTAIKILEYFSERPALVSDAFPPHTNKREVAAFLEEEMENPPSSSTLTRIFKELDDQGYIEAEYGRRSGRWYPTEKAKALEPVLSDTEE